MAGDDCGLVGERGQKADHVADQFGLREGANLDRVGRAAETPHVGCDNVIAGLAQGSQLVPPGIPALGETVAQDDARTVRGSRFRNVQANSLAATERQAMSTTSVLRWLNFVLQFCPIKSPCKIDVNWHHDVWRISLQCSSAPGLSSRLAGPRSVAVRDGLTSLLYDVFIGQNQMTTQTAAVLQKSMAAGNGLKDVVAGRTATMTKVFVHGNPETTAVWEPLLPALANRGVEDIILLSPPGFGTPFCPASLALGLRIETGWCREIEKIGHPVDLLGHDWGAGHTYAVAAVRPNL